MELSSECSESILVTNMIVARNLYPRCILKSDDYIC